MSTAYLPEMMPERDFQPSVPAAETTGPLHAAVAVLHPSLSFPKSDVAAVPAKALPRNRRAARRRARVDWDAIIVIALMLSCAAVGVYRLIWMGQ